MIGGLLFNEHLTDNHDGQLKVRLQDDVHGVLWGIPRWIEAGKMTPAIG